MRKIATLFAMCFLTAMAAGAQDCFPLIDLSSDGLCFKDGEKLTLSVHYKWGMVDSDVASGKFTVDSLDYDGTGAYAVRLYCKSSKAVSSVFKVKEDFKATVRADDLMPLRFDRDTKEGSYYAKNTYLYDWTAEEPHIAASLDDKRKGARDMDIPLTSCTYDLMSLIARVRHIDFEGLTEGVSYPLCYALGSKVKDMNLVYMGMETKKIKGLGKIRVRKFGVKSGSSDGIDSDSDMEIYLSDDANRLPVYFSCPLSVGSFSGTLEKYEGIKYPFDSLSK